MNAIKLAKQSITNPRAALSATRQARQTVTQRQRRPVVTCAQVLPSGTGMWRVVDATSGRVLGFRQRFRDAHQLADALERGKHA